MQSLLAGLSIVAAARGLAVDRNEIELVRPAFCDPGRKAGHEQVRIDPVHHRAQPVGAGDAMVELRKAPEKRQMRVAPVDDVVIVITVRDCPAHDQKKNFAKRIGDLPGLPRILDLRQVIEQQAQPGLG
jgi:hypothetical protein